MTTLEFCHELDFSKINFLERKKRITHPKTIIKGSSKTGKSYLIFDYLSTFNTQDYLYIDFQDFRNDIEEIKENLQDYILKNKIKVVVFENFDFSIKLPFCDNIIISTKEDRKIKGFRNLNLMPLDFEEFLLHENKNHNITQSFNTFLKFGNLPQTVYENEFLIYTNLQNLIKIINPNTTSEDILKTLIFNIDEKKSLNQLYLNLKSKIKISKDKFYEECKRFENENIIYFIEKFNQKKAVKKIYSYNPALLTAITHKRKFKNEFTNLVFLELKNRFEDIFYLDYIDFYLPNKKLAIICIPFFNSYLMQSQLRKIRKNLQENEVDDIYILTVSNTEEFLYNDFKINVLPFYEWALS